MLDLQTISLIIALIGMSGGFVWKLSRVETALRHDIVASENTLRKDFGVSKDEIDKKQDIHSHDFGETITAMREKINQVELYAANTYVRRDGFYKVQEQLTTDIKVLGDKIDKRLERMEAKIDSKT